jgi:hypothetical protein
MPEIVTYKVPTMATMKVNRLLGYAPTVTTERGVIFMPKTVSKNLTKPATFFSGT